MRHPVSDPVLMFIRAFLIVVLALIVGTAIATVGSLLCPAP